MYNSLTRALLLTLALITYRLYQDSRVHRESGHCGGKNSGSLKPVVVQKRSTLWVHSLLIAASVDKDCTKSLYWQNLNESMFNLAIQCFPVKIWVYLHCTTINTGIVLCDLGLIFPIHTLQMAWHESVNHCCGC